MQYFLRSGAAEQDFGPLGLLMMLAVCCEHEAPLMLASQASANSSNFLRQTRKAFWGDDSFYADGGAARGDWRGDSFVII